MKVIKPLRLSMLNRPYSWQGKNYLGVSVLALADMGESPRLRPEQELWQLAAEELQTSGGVLDLAIPKACPEFLATGYAYTHHQAEKTACMVKIQLEQREKTLLAFGDRHWVNNHPSVPLAFEKMRLDWSHAFGGSSYANNPFGLGAEAETIDGIKIHRLPNIESPHQRITAPRQQADPAGFGPLDITWPARFARIGKKYDAQWLQNEFPGFARDIDWRLFNAAPGDQWWEKLDALPAEAPWRIWNMHPEKPLQEGRLPPWHARCFINRIRAEDEVFEEIALRATTVWFFPHREQMVLIWHGSSRINEDDAADVLNIMPALECTGFSRSTNHYRKVLHQRLDKERGALFTFREKDLLPESTIGPWLDTEVSANESPMRSNLMARKEIIRQEYLAQRHSREPDISETISSFEIEETPVLENMPEFVEKLEQQAEKMRTDARDRLNQHTNSSTPDDAPRGPESMHRMLEILHNSNHGLPDNKLIQTEQALYQMYQMSVQAQQPALRLTGELAQIIRNRTLRTMELGGDFSGLDFTGADLSGMDLHGANFSNALLESADLSHCCLDGANFSNAMLARADISNSELNSVVLDDACLTQIRCYGSNFTGASLKNTQLQEARLENCIFDKTHWEAQILYKTSFSHCRFHSAHFENILFLELSAPALDFSRAYLNKGAFIKCTLEHIVFNDARLENCSWVETQMHQASFRQAELNSCAFTAGTMLNAADFSHSTLIYSNLRQTALQSASFHMARLDNSDLSEADCQCADMSKMNASGSMFIRTDLRSAKLNNSNLMGALMQKCRLSGADLRNANLFRTDMSQSRIDTTTQLDGAYTKRTKTLPKRSREVV